MASCSPDAVNRGRLWQLSEKKLALTGSQEYPDFTTVVAPKSTKGGVTLVHLILRTRVFRGFEEKGALPFPGKIRGAADASLRSHCPVQVFGNG